MSPVRTNEKARRPGGLLIALPPVIVAAAFGLLSLDASPTRLRILIIGALTAAAVAAVNILVMGREQRARDALKDALHRTAAGDLTLSRRELRRTGDPELSRALHGLLVGMERILTSFVRMSEAVSGVARELSLRGRDLSRAAVVQTRRAEETALSIERTDSAINSLKVAMETLSAATENASSSIHEMSASITEVSRSASGLRNFVDETSLSLNQMLQSLGEVSRAVGNVARLAEETARATSSIKEATEDTDRQTRTAARLAERVTAATHAGKVAVSGTVQGINAIRQTVSGAAEAAAILAERSERIGEILRVIEEIAGETNLLALNASIIAAQAGESGRAFSTLAIDIRDLSERTALSTEEVRSLVTAVDEGVRDVRKLLLEARNRTEEGVELVQTADGTLDDILELSAESKKASEGIASSAAMQANDVARVSEASTRVSEEVDRIFRATEGHVQTAEAVVSKAERVKELTEQLSRAMEEQATGGTLLLQTMSNISSTTGRISLATTTLREGSASVVRSMEGIREATAQNEYAASAMNQTALALEQEALSLNARSSVFRFPSAAPGGRIRAALRYLNEEDYDPAFSQTVPHAILVKTWGESLVRFAEGTRVLPELAERWEVDSTGTLFTFHLRRGVRFHDGLLLSSTDVKNTLERFLSPALGALLAGLFEAIEGAPEFLVGNATSIPGIETPDPSTVRFRLSRPLPFFLHLLTLPDISILPPSLVNDRSRARLSPCGTGPFVVKDLRFGKAARFDRFDSYWDRSHVALDGVDLDLTEDSEAGVFQRFLDGQLDVIWDIPISQAARLSTDPQWRAYIDSTVQLHTSFVVLRCDRAPLNDPRLRRALNHAVDRNELNQKLFSGLTVVASSILPPHLLGHDSNLRPLRYDPEESRRLMAEAGFKDGMNLVAWMTPTDVTDPMNPMKGIAAMLEKAGVKVTIEILSGEEMSARRKRGEWPHLRLSRWFADFPDPDSFFNSLFYSKSEDVAEFGFSNPEIDRLVERGARTSDTRERELIYRELNRRIQHEAPAIFLFHNRGFVLHAPKVRGVRAFLLPPPVRWADLSFEV